MSSTDTWDAEMAERSYKAASASSMQGVAEFSALNLRDRVVIMLLFDQIVREEQVADVWPLWKQQSTSETELPLWRMLTLVPELNRELIFAEVARVYDIEQVHIERRGALSIIEKAHHHFPDALWDVLVQLRTVPVDRGKQQHSQRERLIFATHDPMNPDLLALLPKLGLEGYEVRYAPEEEVVDLLASAFPWKYKAIRDAMDAERAMFAEVSEAEPEVEEEEAPDSSTQQTDGVSFDTSSVMGFFEEVLVEAVRRQSESVCITPNDDGQTELFFQRGNDITDGMVVDGLQPNMLMTTIKHSVIKAPDARPGETQTHVIKRWIDGTPTQFHVSALPPSDTINLESIVVRVLE